MELDTTARIRRASVETHSHPTRAGAGQARSELGGSPRGGLVGHQVADSHNARTCDCAARLAETAAGVAHTVRNPLHGLLNCVEILEAHLDGDPDATETLALMREGLASIDRVTRRLLGFAHISCRNPERTNLADLFAAVERRMRCVALGAEIRLHVDLPPEELHAVIDAQRVAEALSNVIDNAIDACVPGGSVTIRCRGDAERTGGLAIEVEDTGSGIAREHLDFVLDPFFTTKPPDKGFGLGLAIVRGVMDEHGGSVDIVSREGAGSRVCLLFPARCLESRIR